MSGQRRQWTPFQEDAKPQPTPPGPQASQNSNRDTKLLEIDLNHSKQRTAPRSNRDKNAHFRLHQTSRPSEILIGKQIIRSESKSLKRKESAHL
jgi:hypothetical protein